jgi:hypothetical protein
VESLVISVTLLDLLSDSGLIDANTFLAGENRSKVSKTHEEMLLNALFI